MDNGRRTRLLFGLGVAAAILLGKIAYIQLFDSHYKEEALRNTMVYDIIYPTRGVIYDRNGKILVGNKVAYDIMVTPKEVDLLIDRAAFVVAMGINCALQPTLSEQELLELVK